MSRGPLRTIARAAVCGMVTALALASLGFAAWLVLNPDVVGSEHATDPSAQPSGERAEPCTELDGACIGYGEIRESPVQRPSATQLMAEHECWTMRDGAPADVDLPGGVVVRVDGGDPEYSTNAMVIGAALDAALDDAENGVEAIAFCRGDQP